MDYKKYNSNYALIRQQLKDDTYEGMVDFWCNCHQCFDLEKQYEREHPTKVVLPWKIKTFERFNKNRSMKTLQTPANHYDKLAETMTPVQSEQMYVSQT